MGLEKLFQFEISDNQGQKSLRIMGKMYTVAVQFCNILQKGFIEGEVNIDIDDGLITFITKDISLKFSEDCKKIAYFENMIKIGNVKIEPCKNIQEGYEGFQLIFTL